MMESERYDSYKDPEVEQFLANVIATKPELVPIFDLEFGYRYPDVEEWLKKKPKESKEFLERLAKVRILERKLYAMELRCPKCDKPNIATSYVCPFCKSIDIKRDALIEHLTCGFIDVLTNFKSDGDYTCPKCHGKLEVGRYRSVGSWYACANCGKRVEFPTPQHGCRSCGSIFNLDNSVYERVYVYSLSKISKEEISHGMLLGSAIKGRVAAAGYDVKAPYVTKGDSGVEHTFDMLLLKQGAEIAVDVILSDSPISQLEIIKEYVKLFDTKACVYLIVMPALSDEARKLVEFYKMNAIESASTQGALEALVARLLASEKGTAAEKPITTVAETQKEEEKGKQVSGLKKMLGLRSLLRRRK